MPEHFSFRWGIPILDDLKHTTVYNFLLEHYAELGVTPIEMMFIIHLSQFHYESSKGKAAPSLVTIARMMGYKDEQQVRKIKNSLRKKKLLTVTEQPGRPNTYNFTAFAKRAFAIWQREHPEGTETPQTDDTPIQSYTPIQKYRGAKEHDDPTPIQSYTPPLSNRIPEEIKEKENHESSSPVPTSARESGDGDGGKKKGKPRHISYLLDQGMGAAAEFTDLDTDTAIRDFDNRRRAGQSPGHIVRAWREKRPTPDTYFGKPAQNGTAPAGWTPPADALSGEARVKKLQELKPR